MADLRRLEYLARRGDDADVERLLAGELYRRGGESYAKRRAERVWGRVKLGAHWRLRVVQGDRRAGEIMGNNRFLGPISISPPGPAPFDLDRNFKASLECGHYIIETVLDAPAQERALRTVKRITWRRDEHRIATLIRSIAIRHGRWVWRGHRSQREPEQRERIARDVHALVAAVLGPPPASALQLGFETADHDWLSDALAGMQRSLGSAVKPTQGDQP